MARTITSVAVLGAGTMGIGIAGLCADRGCKVLLLDLTKDAADKGLDRITNGRPPAIDDAAKAANITTGTFDDDMEKIAGYDWVCEAVIEDLETKRTMMARIEAARGDGSVVSSNTSGIPLAAITDGLPDRLRRNVAVTHFFNPVKVMHLVELVPGADTKPDVIDTLAAFLGKTLGKGVVHAKDTVNFVGNRIGCFWMLRGLHAGDSALAKGQTMEMLDAAIAGPMGLPKTGLYGLIDLIGLDVMDFVAKNLDLNLPKGDAGRAYTKFPSGVQAMLDRGQFGRKTGGGFYKMTKLDDGTRRTETYDLSAGAWRDGVATDVEINHTTVHGLLVNDDLGAFLWGAMGETLCYAADLVPDISATIVGVDRAMRWGFAWEKGPFELIDAIGPSRIIHKAKAEGRPVPKMLQVLVDAGAVTFYRNDGAKYLGTDGKYHPTPPE